MKEWDFHWKLACVRPGQPGEYLTATVTTRIVDAKTGLREVRYMGRDVQRWDGLRWEHAEFSHWREVAR